MIPQEKILVVRVGLGGDLVMITPALQVLLAAFPEADFHLLTTGEGRRVLGGFSDRITQTWLYHRRFLRTQLLQRQLSHKFKQEGFTRIFVFEARSFYRSWLQGLAPHYQGMDQRPDGGHYSLRCLEMVEDSLRGIGTEILPRPWISLPVTAGGIEMARALLGQHGIRPGTKLIGLHPTFSGSSFSLFRDRKGVKHRTWPPHNFARLAQLLTRQAAAKGVPLALVIDALPEERRFIEPIISASEDKITLITSPPDFQRFKGYLQELDLLVTPNTGPMHFAAALGTQVVGLFSDWAVDDCGPYVAHDRFEILEARTTAHPELGLAAITAEQVADAVWRNMA